MATLGISGAGGTRFERFKASESLLPSGYPEQPEVTHRPPGFFAPQYSLQVGQLLCPLRVTGFPQTTYVVPNSSVQPSHLSL